MQESPVMQVLLNDRREIHNKYLENRVLTEIIKYEEAKEAGIRDYKYLKLIADRAIYQLGSNQVQISKYVEQGMDTKWKEILERMFKMYDQEIDSLDDRVLKQKKVQFSYICTKRPFLALYDRVLKQERNKNRKKGEYFMEDYIICL
jgi:hypothetical protein